MNKCFRIDGDEYDSGSLPEEGKALLELMTFVQSRVQELTNQMALHTRAKNAYISDLKAEIIQGRTGVDLGALFSDD